MNAREVWITGLGAVTGAGVGTAPLARMLARGEGAVRPDRTLGMTLARPPALPLDRTTRRLDPAGALFYAAGLEAWRDAGLVSPPDARRTELIEGSSLGPLAAALEEYARTLRTGDPIRPTTLVRCLSGAGGAALALCLGIRGAVYHLSAGSISATAAIGEAARRIARGEADVIVTGGGEATLHPAILGTFQSAGLLATDGTAAPSTPHAPVPCSVKAPGPWCSRLRGVRRRRGARSQSRARRLRDEFRGVRHDRTGPQGHRCH